MKVVKNSIEEQSGGVANRPQCVNLAVNRKDGSILVRIPAGEFTMGDGEDGNCPKHKVFLSEYWIGLYCITNKQYSLFVTETGHRIPEKGEFGKSVWENDVCPTSKLHHPVVGVSYDDAIEYAEWAGLSLPTEAQWEKASRGPSGWIYPWGREFLNKVCRCLIFNSETMTLVREHGATVEVWSHPDGASGYGTFQQSGNASEWCADWYGGNYYKHGEFTNPPGPRTGSSRIVRDGGCVVGAFTDVRGAYRTSAKPSRGSILRGFRLTSCNSEFAAATKR